MMDVMVAVAGGHEHRGTDDMEKNHGVKHRSVGGWLVGDGGTT
jgi:hypothetical protein